MITSSGFNCTLSFPVSGLRALAQTGGVWGDYPASREYYTSKVAKRQLKFTQLQESKGEKFLTIFDIAFIISL